MLRNLDSLKYTAYAAFLSADDDRYEELEATLKDNFAERNKEIEAQLVQFDADARQESADLEAMRQRMPLEQKERRPGTAIAT